MARFASSGMTVVAMVVAGLTDVDWMELVEGCAKGDRLTRVVVTCQHLMAGMGMSEISVLEASKVTGTSSAGFQISHVHSNRS